jgi:hypothetical protein
LGVFTLEGERADSEFCSDVQPIWRGSSLFNEDMSTKLHSVDPSSPKFRGYLRAKRWTLCVGAGVSRGIAPTWLVLANQLINEAFGANLDSSTFETMVSDSGWSLDAWIQVAANEFALSGKSIDKFNEALEGQLYSNIREKARGLGLEKYLTQVLNRPKSAPKNRILEVCEFIDSTFPDCSLLGLVRFLVDAAKAERGPMAVLTFNADTFLETLIDLYLRREHYSGPGPYGHPRYYFVSLSRPGVADEQKIPIFHCHGSIAPRYDSKTRPHDARGRLVFQEDEYLAAATTGAMWSETVFLFYAQSSKIAFVGMSMSDSNIRRWMSALQREKKKDLHLFHGGERANPEHIWITTQPRDINGERISLVSQVHLGVRPAWIKGWSALSAGLRNLAGLW